MPDWITPHWPHGFDSWYVWVVLIVTGCTKLYRGFLMHRRAPVIDALGWSIILFDYLFGASLVLAAVWTVYPRVRTHDVVLTSATVVLVIALWQVWAIHRVSHARIQASIGATDTHVYDGTPATDRRVGPPDRRRATADIYNRDRGDAR